MEELEAELSAYAHLLLARTDPVHVEGVQGLMEVATAISARLAEMEMVILRGENTEGGPDFDNNSEYHRFRTSELRAAQSLAGAMVTLGSRRITWANVLVDRLEQRLPRYGPASSIHPLIWVKAVYAPLGDSVPATDNVEELQGELDVMVATLWASCRLRCPMTPRPCWSSPPPTTLA